MSSNLVATQVPDMVSATSISTSNHELMQNKSLQGIVTSVDLTADLPSMHPDAAELLMGNAKTALFAILASLPKVVAGRNQGCAPCASSANPTSKSSVAGSNLQENVNKQAQALLNSSSHIIYFWALSSLLLVCSYPATAVISVRGARSGGPWLSRCARRSSRSRGWRACGL
jgi:hypothetical protein